MNFNFIIFVTMYFTVNCKLKISILIFKILLRLHPVCINCNGKTAPVFSGKLTVKIEQIFQPFCTYLMSKMITTVFSFRKPIQCYKSLGKTFKDFLSKFMCIEPITSPETLLSIKCPELQRPRCDG